MEELRLKEAELEQRVKSNTHRIEQLEKDNTVLHEMSATLQVMANEIKHMREAQNDMNDRIKTIEEEPRERLNEIIRAVVVAVIGVAVGLMFGGGIL